MTLVYNSQAYQQDKDYQDTNDGRKYSNPYTHVFIIGAGHYPYIKRCNQLSHLSNQLASPPISAKEFANWVISSFHNPTASLGRVWMLLSPQQSYICPTDQVQNNVESATRSNIDRYFRQWYEHCHQNSENIAIFYFCGHGIGENKTHLVCEDAGHDRFNPTQVIIDFDMTYWGMTNCSTKNQYYFIDACRNRLSDGEIFPSPLIEPSPSNSQCLEARSRFYSTLSNLTAWGSRGNATHRVTPFTEALIQSFDGLGSRRDEDAQWIVDSSGISDAILAYMKWKGEQYRHPDNSSLSKKPIHFLQVTFPRILVNIDVTPPPARTSATLSLDDGNGSIRHCDPGVQKPWKLNDITAGEYNINANFHNRYRDIIERALMGPPVYPRTLQAMEL